MEVLRNQGLFSHLTEVAMCVGLVVLGTEASSTPITPPAVVCEAPVLSQPELDFAQIAEQVRTTPFFMSAEEYRNLPVGEQEDFFKKKGIVVRIEGSYQKPPLETYGWLLSNLAFTPQAIIDASGLKEIIIEPTTEAYQEADKGFDYKEPKHTNGSLVIKHSSDLDYGLAAMIRDNCQDKDRMMQVFQAITNEAGEQYDPAYKPQFVQKGEGRSEVVYAEDTFDSPDSAVSPEDEFVFILSSMISGYDYSREGQTALNKKRDLVRAVLYQILPQEQAFRQFTNYAGYYGTHGLHPQDIPDRIQCMSDQLAGKSEAEQEHIFQVDAGNEEPDAQVVDCDPLDSRTIPSQYQTGYPPVSPVQRKLPYFSAMRVLVGTRP